MAQKKAAEDQPLPWAGDDHDGQGGSYLYDPTTNTRTLVERTDKPKAEKPAKAEGVKRHE